jgi:P-type Ca2+ transporter type 2C
MMLNAVIGFVQEYRAEKAIAALKKMAAHSATVIRDGTTADVPAANLVPGDIVLLDAGKIIPADLRLFEAAQLQVEEAALTGESVPVEKHLRPLPDEMMPVGDRKNMAFKGTTVTYGRGGGVVVGTGSDTELGKIASLIGEEEEVKTPLQKRLNVFGRNLALAVLALCGVIFALGIVRGEEPLFMLLTAISLAVAAIPEALPAVVTIALALGARKMVKQNALIRKLPAVETLGSVTYICSDKTGTLTLNRMTVEEIFVDGRIVRMQESECVISGGKQVREVAGRKSPDEACHLLLTALALSNDAAEDNEGNLIGDPTETALYVAAREAGYEKVKLQQVLPRAGEIPFDSERKCMTTLHNASAGFAGGDYQGVSFTKGAIEVLLDRSVHVLESGRFKEIAAEEIRRVGERMAADGLRVLGIGMKRWESVPREISPEVAETDLVLLGLVGMMDPPREEAAKAVGMCRSAGIRPVMITGDHPLTARAIAKRIGISGEDVRSVMTGRKLSELPMEDFEERVLHISVYARVAPEQKLKIIKALQDKGQFVAMTGDGVNDAPALKRADIGIAMGITGTDVAKEASHMILLDDNFATIVKAVREGRRIFDNIRKFIRYTMTSNSGEVWTIFLAPFFGLPIPLLPIHILWINLVTDGLPGLALAAEPAEKKIMERNPRDPKENIFSGMWLQIIWIGLLMGAVCVGTQAWALNSGLAQWQTMVFTVLCFSQMGNVLALRSERESLFSQGLFSNKPLVGAFVLTILLQLGTIYIPFLNPIFRTQPLSTGELALTFAVSSVVFLAVELEKWWKRRAR